MEPASTPLWFAAVALILVNAAFVAAEFAIVSVERAAIEELARAGNRRARFVLAGLERPHEYLAAAQLGITAASLGLGYVAALLFHRTLIPQLAGSGFVPAAVSPAFTSAGGVALSIVAAAVLVVLLHAVVATRVPRMLGARSAESTALVTAGPVLLFAAVFGPVVRLTSMLASRLARALGLEPTDPRTMARTPDQIRRLVERSHEEGMVEEDEREMIRRVFECRDRVARDVMTPRPDIVALPVTASLEEVLDKVVGEGHSRIPVHGAGLDDIVGILLAKDLIPCLARRDEADDFDLRSILREPYFVPDTKRVDELIAEFRAKGIHLAVVLDEFGGTEGLVTLEDLLEEIVGDIYDEYDLPEPDELVRTEEGHILLDGRASISDVNGRLGLGLSAGDYTTMGGYVMGALGRVPLPGDRVPLDGSGELRVEQTRDRRVVRLRLIPADGPRTGETEPGTE